MCRSFSLVLEAVCGDGSSFFLIFDWVLVGSWDFDTVSGCFLGFFY